jgi:anti-sigma28 factor (negative regulator of flagellin synthesis)
MQAIRKPSIIAHLPRSASESSRRDAQSPEQNPSATSGAYFRAVRPTDSEAAALGRGEPGIDCAKVEGLRFELDVGIWRSDSERVAQCVIADAACLDGDLADE